MTRVNDERSVEVQATDANSASFETVADVVLVQPELENRVRVPYALWERRLAFWKAWGMLKMIGKK